MIKNKTRNNFQKFVFTWKAIGNLIILFACEKNETIITESFLSYFLCKSDEFIMCFFPKTKNTEIRITLEHGNKKNMNDMRSAWKYLYTCKVGIALHKGLRKKCFRNFKNILSFKARKFDWGTPLHNQSWISFIFEKHTYYWVKLEI